MVGDVFMGPDAVCEQDDLSRNWQVTIRLMTVFVMLDRNINIVLYIQSIYCSLLFALNLSIVFKAYVKRYRLKKKKKILGKAEACFLTSKGPQEIINTVVITSKQNTICISSSLCFLLRCFLSLDCSDGMAMLRRIFKRVPAK